MIISIHPHACSGPAGLTNCVAHPTDIYSVTPTPQTLVTASGSSTIRIYRTTASSPSTPTDDAAAAPSTDPFPLVAELRSAHAIGCHHVAAAVNGQRFVSAGFGGEVKVWDAGDESGAEWRERQGTRIGNAKTVKAGEIWAVALTADGRYMATSSADGKVSMWELDAKDVPASSGGQGDDEAAQPPAPAPGGVRKVRDYETKGSFGISVDVSADGRLAASGHENGGVYIFNNESGRLLHSLPGLMKPVRAVRFSPATTLLAAAGDARLIALYEVSSGEAVATLSGHVAWIMSLDFSATGEWLLSTSFDGKAKVWGTESRSCVATHGEGGNDDVERGKALWCGRWLPKRQAVGNVRAEMFAVAGASRAVSIYREASGG